MSSSNAPQEATITAGDLTVTLHRNCSNLIDSLTSEFLSRRSAQTRRAYEDDLRAFASFIGVGSPSAALQTLVTLKQGQANALALSYKNHLIESGLSPATVNRRLATLRSAIKLANQLGLVNWKITIENEKAESYRDTTGPGRDGFRALLEWAENQRNVTRATRDVAILRLLYDLALRRGEVVSLDLSDYDAENRTVAVLGKGRATRTLLTLPEPTEAALRCWIEVRGNHAGPLFTNCDRAGKGQLNQSRLTGRAVHYLVQQLGRKAGLSVRPHGLRHAAITEALDLTRGDVRSAQRYSRHRNLQTLMVYDDNRRDLAGEVARMVAATVTTQSVDKSQPCAAHPPAPLSAIMRQL